MVIMALYFFNMLIDLFSETGSTFFRIVLYLLAWVDFVIFCYVILSKLSAYLSFPILNLPANLGKGGEGQQIPNDGDYDNEVEKSQTKLESSMENTFEVENQEPADIESAPIEDYAQDLEFDDDKASEEATPEQVVQGNRLEAIDPVADFEDTFRDVDEDEDDKEGDVSYQNDFDGDDEI